MKRFDPKFLDEVRARTPLSALVVRWVPLRREGGEMAGLCPFHGERSPSFYVVEKKGFAHCFGCGWHGDAFKFMQALHGLDFVAAVETLAIEAGMMMPRSGPAKPLQPKIKRPSAEDAAREREQSIAGAVEVWRSARPATGTAVETYLATRAITLPPPPTIRFHPALRHFDSDTGKTMHLPAMVAAFQGVDRSVTGVHRTYLAPGGGGKAAVKKAKMMAGACWGSAIRLAPAAPRLAIAEGIETALSVMQACPDLPVWVAGSLGNIAGAGDSRVEGPPHPTRKGLKLPTERPDMKRPGIVLPKEVREVILLADADGDPHIGAALVERAVRRFIAEGRKVSVAWPQAGQDFNDMLRGAA